MALDVPAVFTFELDYDFITNVIAVNFTEFDFPATRAFTYIVIHATSLASSGLRTYGLFHTPMLMSMYQPT